MGRPSNKELARRAQQLPAAAIDPRSAAFLTAARQRFLYRVKRDADFWYEAAQSLVMFGTTKEDDPRVKLILGVMRTLVAEQRQFPSVGTDAPPATPTQVNIILPGGAPLNRGTLAARNEAIEVQVEKRVGENEQAGGGARA